MKFTHRLISRFTFLLCVCLIAPIAAAQSTDITAPSAIRTNEISGEIAARDIGDARLTDHYYTFTGTPGDLLITVQSQNLDGDVDIFTASGLRPLLKFSLYAGTAPPLTKSIYLRTTEQLILRIEGRTPNDDRGVYRFRFGGSFEPITTGPLVAEVETAPVDPLAVPTPAPMKGRRVSSVGARIDEPAAPEVAVAPAPEPTPEAVESKPVDPDVAEEAKPAARPPARSNRGRRLPGRRTRTPPPATAEETATTPSTLPETPAEQPSEVATPAPRGRRGSRRGAAAPATQPVAEPEIESGPRLIIETSDGTLINRYMSSVRRVTVENGRVVVIGKDGKIERFALETVVRMSIAP